MASFFEAITALPILFFLNMLVRVAQVKIWTIFRRRLLHNS